MRVEQKPIEDRRRTGRDPRHPGPKGSAARDGLAQAYLQTRSESVSRIAGLSDADATVQSMEDASPAKWHLAHTTWFFETFVLLPASPDHQAFDERFGFLFNSYYEALGERQPRPRRGLLTRPTLQTVLDYRESIDSKVLGLLESEPPRWLQERVELGIQHEQQHQELLLTDLLHLFSQNPLLPAYRSLAPGQPPLAPSLPAALDRKWIDLPGGIAGIGAGADGFAFDCERPRHDALIRPFRLASTPVRNREWREFMQDGGYATAALWLADGWDRVKREGWSAPLHWQARDGDWAQMTLHGLLPIDPEAPVCHVSYFEADAYARWADKRLPTEFEWEHAATWRRDAFHALDDQIWQWTSSAFDAYPGFKPLPGAIGEYNGKFMNGQRVLRGGSLATPAGHARPSYRNFFQPEKRWQFSGLRLAEDDG